MQTNEPDEEYDPYFPNSYEVLRTKKLRSEANAKRSVSFGKTTTILESSDRSPCSSQNDQSSTEAKKSPLEHANIQKSRVVLLTNMVGPGEVDDELEGETKEECLKFGAVIKCLIFEVVNKKVPADEAVRIFVEFKDQNAAERAYESLNGRYFGGRTVKAAYYDIEKFNKYQLV